MNPEDKSDALDRKIVALSAIEYHRQRLKLAMIAATLVFVIVGFIGQFIILQKISRKTDNTLNERLPALRLEISERDKTISDQRYVIDHEAIPIITRLTKQVQSLGGDPGQVTLKSIK